MWISPLNGDRKPVPFLRTPANESSGRFSSDGNWIAYQSDDTGADEVYVQSFAAGSAGTKGKWPISTQGGKLPRWRRDGNELFYLSGDGKLMAVDFRKLAGRSFKSGQPKTLFQTRATGSFSYDVPADGQRFLINTPVEEAPSLPVTVVINWTEGLP